MPVTTDDVEKELQEEFARKNRHKTNRDVDATWIPKKCLIVLGVGVGCALVFVFFPFGPEMKPANDQLPLLSQVAQPTGRPVSVTKGLPKTKGTHEEQREQTDVRWLLAIGECFGGQAVSCDALCADEALQCDVASLSKVRSSASFARGAFKTAGVTCDALNMVGGVAGAWDGPHAFGSSCTSTMAKLWTPSCSSTPPCGYSRLCACKGDLESADKNAPRKFKIASRIPFMWWNVADRLPSVVPGDWASETMFLDRLLRQFGKLTVGYKGSQMLAGFRPGMLFDEEGMFAFAEGIRSVAIDVGAATNPLAFDIETDASQVGLFFEPVQWKTLEESLESQNEALYKKSNCRLDYKHPACTKNRVLVFPAAVSSVVGTARFHVTKNAYCGSLENFVGGDAVAKSDIPEVREIFDQCYHDEGQNRIVPTISLKAVIERIPKHIIIKYVKIDAQGHDFKVLLSAGDQMSRIEYVRFEMQVDPPPGHKLVKDIPSYAEVLAQMMQLGFKPAGASKRETCFFDHGASKFSLAVHEKECVFCRTPPCVESGRQPLGPNPLAEDTPQPYSQPPLWYPNE